MPKHEVRELRLQRRLTRPHSGLLEQKLALSRFTFGLLCLCTASSALALGPIPEFRKQELKPSTRYSGSAPIDMSHGMLGQNGTFGLPNAEYEAWSQAPTLGVSLSQKSYAYGMRERLIATLNERLNFYRDALWNLRQTAKNANPAVEEGYKATAPAAIEAPLKDARTAWEELKSSGESGWSAAEQKAKDAFVKLQTAYYQLHANTALTK